MAYSQTSFDEKVTSQSNVRLSVTNVGTFGNSFRGYRDGSSNESCEYPAGSGTEHIFESGIWIGGLISGQKVVSTSALDAPSGYRTGAGGFEYAAEIGSSLEERSTFKDSPFFTPLAVSHQDYVSKFSDKFDFVPGTSIPLGGDANRQRLFVDVNLRTYNFNFAFSDFVVFVDMDIVNLGRNGGENLIDSLFIGLWANTVVRNINVTPAGSGGAAFYDKGGNGYIDSLQMAYCYDYSGDVGFTNSYVGQKFLGASDKFGFHHPRLDSTFNSNYNTWIFNNPGTGVFQAPAGDPQRYDRLTKGVEDEDCWDVDNGQCGGGTFQEQLNRAGNRSDLVSVGPFRDFRRGDTISISYAFILAEKLEDGSPYTDNTPEQMAQFISNAQRAQTAFYGEDVNQDGVLDADEDIDGNGALTRFILPSPPDIPETRVEVGDSKVDIYWTDNSEFSVDPISQSLDFEGYRLYITRLGYDVLGVPNLLRDLVPLAEFDIKGNGFANEIGLDDIKLQTPKQFDGDPKTYTYKYTINNLLNGWQYAVGLSAFDTGNPDQNLESLESSLLANNFRVFPGKAANPFLENDNSIIEMEKDAPYAFPDPYYFGASWEGKSNFQEQSRKITFANLPKRCLIKVYTPAGDLIDEISHDENYKGEDIRWFETFASENPEDNVFSGSHHSWDLLSLETQIISRGIYLLVVEDLETGNIRKGKFTILK